MGRGGVKRTGWRGIKFLSLIRWQVSKWAKEAGQERPLSWGEVCVDASSRLNVTE